MKSIVIGFCCSVSVCFAPACKKDEPIQYPAPQSTQDAAPPPAPPAPVSDGGSPPAADAGPSPLDPVVRDGLAGVIAERAKKDAKGMKAVGELIGGVVPEGGKVEGGVMLEAGKCYAVVGSAAPGVVELDLEIQAKPSPSLTLPGPVIAVDSGSGNSVSITPCWKNPFPMGFMATVVVKATRGAGAVGAQVYVK